MTSFRYFPMTFLLAKLLVSKKTIYRPRNLCIEALTDRELCAADLTLSVVPFEDPKSISALIDNDLRKAIAFPRTAIGEANVLYVAIRNNLASSISVDSFTSTNANFSILGPVGNEISAEGVINLGVQFSPHSLDTASSTISFNTGIEGESRFEFVVESGVEISEASGVAPRVETVLFGEATSQRSMINEIKVSFDSEVVVDANAFLLEVGSNSSGSYAPVNFMVNQTAAVVTGKTVVQLTFSGSGIVGDSLPDGNYRLTALSSAIRSSDGSMALDGDSNGMAGGNFVEGESISDNFFRLFGDSNGDGVVEGTSTANPFEIDRFRETVGRSVGQPLFNPVFDSNNDGHITPNDTNEFRRRVGKSRAF